MTSLSNFLSSGILICFNASICDPRLFKLPFRAFWTVDFTRCVKFGIILVVVTLVALSVTVLDRRSLSDLLIWLQANPGYGSVVFVVMYSLGLVLLLPGSLLSLGAGAVYGMYIGTLLTWVATVIGQTLAFLLGRYLLRDMVMEFTYSRYPKWLTVDQALAREGWKFVCLLRLSPIMPYSVLNYILSITSVGFIQYSIVSALTCLPWVVTFVYFGSVVQTLTDVSEGQAGPDRATAVILMLLSTVAFLIAGVCIVVMSRDAVSKAMLDAGSKADIDELELVAHGSSDIHVLLDLDPEGEGIDRTRPGLQGPNAVFERAGCANDEQTSR